MQSKRNSKQKPKDFFFELQRHVDFGLEIDLESQTQKFVELEVWLPVLALPAVVETRIEEDTGREIVVDGESERILPFHLRLAVVREIVDASLPV